VDSPPILFTLADSEAAHRAWGFNCGPAAICAALGLRPDGVRPFLEDFRGFMTPTEILAAVARAGWRSRQVWRCVERPKPAAGLIALPALGIARVQWDGPWCNAGVPFGARYQRTHYVAACRGPAEPLVFDVNGEGWMSVQTWENEVVPDLLPPRSPGFWFTHAWEVVRG
jgi:hypothetical protein